MKKKILFIINPKAGTRKSSSLPQEILKTLDLDQFEHEIQYTQYGGHATMLAQQAMNQEFDYIVATGGDGSVNEIGNAMVGSEVALGILPRGSGNGLARSLHIPLKIQEAIKLLNEHDIRKIDSFRVNGRCFFNVAGIGFDGLIAREFADSKARGLRAYVWTILNNLLSFRNSNYTIQFDDDKAFTERSFLVAFANSPQYGNNFTIAPEAIVDDGFLDVCNVRSFFEVTGFQSILHLLSGGMYKNIYVKSRKVRKVAVDCEEELIMHIDGEPFKAGNRIEITAEPLSLNVAVQKTPET